MYSADFSVIELQALTDALRHDYWVFIKPSLVHRPKCWLYFGKKWL